MNLFDVDNLTTKQRDKLFDRDGSRLKKIMAGESSFALDRWQCQKFFNIQNDTFHDPMCYVKDRDGNGQVHVEATFLGSGIISHPVRRAWIPEHEIRAPISLTKIFFLNLWNLIRPPAPEPKKDRYTSVQKQHMMDIQRARNITTGIIHTTKEEYIEDLSRLSGQDMCSIHPDSRDVYFESIRDILAGYMKTTEKLDKRFFNGKLDKEHTGQVPVIPLNYSPEERGM